MKTSRIALIAVLSAAAAVAAHADEVDGSQFLSGVSFQGKLSRAQVQAELEQARKAPNPYSISYNPVANFRSQRTRDQVNAEFLADRNTVAAMNGEDSGSAYLAAHKRTADSMHLAGTPLNAQ